jgi:hypothetical protein
MWQMDMGSIWTRRDINMKGNGKTICPMEEVRRFMLIKVDTMASLLTGKDMAREC